MASTRCTCIYGLTTHPHHRGGAVSAITVHVSDPWCPAAAVHARVAERTASAGCSDER